jgi:hypothetical protein
VTGEHQQSRCDEFLASPGRSSEPRTGDGSGALHPDIVMPLCHLAEVIN